MTDHQQIRKALRDIHATLEPLVVGPPATSLAAQKARYQIGCLTDMLDSELQWHSYQRRVTDWETNQLKQLAKGNRK